jgi:DNA polymerase-1
MNADRLRTKWNGTGARTGRLSSSGDKKKTGKQINLQNIKKDPQMLNLCIADTRWRRVYDKISEILASAAPKVLAYWRVCDREQRKALKRGEKWKPGPMLAAAQAQMARAADLIVAWLREHVPDFKTFLVADYGQMEIRAGAQLSGDKQLIADCEEADIHSTVGSSMTGWDAEAIRHDELIRTLTKNVHFGIFFGLSKQNMFSFVRGMTPPETRKAILARFKRERPDMDPEEAWREQTEEAYDRYFKRYKGVARFIEKQREFGREHKYVTTLFGMIQTLNVTDDFEHDEVIDDDIGGRSAYWGNQAVNGPVQGTAHQVLICALVNLIRKAVKYAILGVPPMEVHDALYFVVEVLKLKKAVRRTRYLLEKESLKTVAKDFPDVDWKVPIVVEIKGGPRLGTKVSVDVDTEPGMFLIDWWRVCRKQLRALDKELMTAAQAAEAEAA